ncbi:MAG: hypothetical protein LBO62_02505, partial [Endomicrobium sp.]|nr:hypothetical protein [Endomicrobium sp.]
MRKLLRLLVAAVFVATAASSAMAITLSTTVAGGTTQKDVFLAEVLFTVSGNFGFNLKKAADAALPNPASDTTVTKVDWTNTSDALLPGVAPGEPGFKNSHVYAQITNELK